MVKGTAQDPVKAKRPLKVLLASMELAPFAKVGGLADVAASLPKAMNAMGHDVRVFMPAYPLVERNPYFNVEPFLSNVGVPIHPFEKESPAEQCHFLRATINKETPVYLVKHDRYFGQACTSSEIYTQEVGSYLFFSRAIFALMGKLADTWIPDVIHCNDWHTGLIPALLKTQYRRRGLYQKTASLFTIHNLAYQGLFGPEVLDSVGLSQTLFSPEGLEFYGQVNFLKAGLVYSDRANTVSPNYAEEIQTEEFGCGLQGLTTSLAANGRLVGILNGIDMDDYNPATDRHIATQFSASHPEGKADNRLALQRECGLTDMADAPVVGMVSRLVAQKGLDLLAPIVERLIQLGFQFVILGQGQSLYEDLLLTLQARYPDRIAVRIAFDEALANRIYAGADAFLMPSRFEPCGLGQMISLRYGTIPIVRKTGGLSDSVVDDDGLDSNATGFVFEGYAPETLLECMKRVRSAFLDRPRWKRLVKCALRSDFSWITSAVHYEQLCRDAVESL